MPPRLEVHAARRFVLETLEPRILLNGAVAAAAGPVAAGAAGAAVVVAPRPEVIYSEGHGLFGETQKLEILGEQPEVTPSVPPSKSGLENNPSAKSAGEVDAFQ